MSTAAPQHDAAAEPLPRPHRPGLRSLLIMVGAEARMVVRDPADATMAKSELFSAVHMTSSGTASRAFRSDRIFARLAESVTVLTLGRSRQ